MEEETKGGPFATNPSRSEFNVNYLRINFLSHDP